MSSVTNTPRRRSSRILQKNPIIVEADPVSDEEKVKSGGEFHFEFGGPIGALGIIFGLPLVILGLYFFCNKEICMENPLNFNWNAFFSNLRSYKFITPEAVWMFLGWIIFHVFLERVLPGESAYGAILPDTKDSRLKYTLSGHLQFWVTLIAMGHAIPIFSELKPDSGIYLLTRLNPLSLDLIYEHYVPLISVSVAFSAALSIYLYVTSFFPGKQMAKGGNTGYHIYDFFIGRELNPRIGR